MQLGEFLTLCLMAVALGMDAFSMSLGLGMKGIRYLHMIKVSLFNGLFHILMPFLGIVVGRYLSSFLGDLAIIFGGVLLIFFGINMIYSSLFKEEENSWVSSSGWGLILFSIGVSMDGFSVGLSLGMFSVNLWLAIMLFGLSGCVLTALGLLLGRKISGHVGEYSETIGGMILLAFGIKFLI
jgi:putative Mn2+ efflux pump MntP